MTATTERARGWTWTGLLRRRRPSPATTGPAGPAPAATTAEVATVDTNLELADHPFVSAAEHGHPGRCAYARSLTDASAPCWRLQEQHPETAATVDEPLPRIYESDRSEPGMATVLLGYGRAPAPKPAPAREDTGEPDALRCQEPTCPDYGDPDFGEATCISEHAEVYDRSLGGRTRIIARFDTDPAEQAETIPPLAPGAFLLPPAIFDRLMHESGLPVWDGGPTSNDVDRSGELLVWNVRGVS